MKLATLLLLAAFPAFAAEPAPDVVHEGEPVSATPPSDAPKVDFDAPGRALILEQGSITPYRGVLLDDQEDISRERARARCAAELASGKGNSWVSTPVLVALIVGALVLGAGVGVGATLAVKKP